jgi:hypothetical protein
LNTPPFLFFSFLFFTPFPQIPVVADLPVGKNLQDHLQMDALIFTLYKNISVTPAKANSLWTKALYTATGGGIKTNSV